MQISEFQQACVAALALWSTDLPNFSDVEVQHRVVLTSLNNFMIGLKSRLDKLVEDNTEAVNQCKKLELIAKKAPTRRSWLRETRLAKKKAEESSTAQLEKREYQMTVFKRMYLRLWDIPPLAGTMDAQTFLDAWDKPHHDLLDIVQLSTSDSCGWLPTVNDLARDRDLVMGVVEDEDMLNLFAEEEIK